MAHCTPEKPETARDTARAPALRVAGWALAALLLLPALPVAAAELEYEEYLQRAGASAKRGDWQSVASQLAQAINHPEQPKSPAERVAVLLQYGRAVGVMCQFDEARTFLLRARALAESHGIAPAAALQELEALQLAQQSRTAPGTPAPGSAPPYGARCPKS